MFDFEQYTIDYSNAVDAKYHVKGKRVLDLGCGSGAMAKRIKTLYQPERMIGVDLQLVTQEEDEGGLTLIDHVNAASLPFEDNYFDVVYSISTFEHIADLPLVMKEIRRVLKPRGSFWASFSPIWTSICGHHAFSYGPILPPGKPINEQVLWAIPPWGHLYLTESEMRGSLESEGISDAVIRDVLHFVYHSPELNRNSASEIREAVMSCGMLVRGYFEGVAFSRAWAFGAIRNSELTEQIKDKICQNNYKLEDIPISYMDISLEKYENIQY